jgi:hypothetical protein
MGLAADLHLKHRDQSPSVASLKVKIATTAVAQAQSSVFTLDPRVCRVMAAEGITQAELSEMLNRAALYRSDGFNRRYYHWVFKVTGRTVEAMATVEVVEVGRGRDSKMREDCESCEGQGCKKCGWRGWILRRV